MKYRILIPIIFFSSLVLGQYECDDKVDNDTTFTGVCKENYPNGKIHYSTTYKNGQKDGLYQEFYENGKLKAKANYSNWEIFGTALRYYSTGTRELEIILDSLGNGSLKRYHKNGQVKQTGQFKLGFRVGLWIEYDSSGKIVSKKEKDEYNWIVNKQKESDEKNNNDDPKDDFYVDWSWTVEEEFFMNEDWY
jgi:antitoxin component YwqK of YwqJK toxin-antitoxin module